MAKKDEVVEETGMTIVQSDIVPSYISQGQARGSESVTLEDMTIPRLEIIQALSPCRDKSNPAYIQGAEEGMLFNNVSREIYGTSVCIIPVLFKKEALIWKNRKLGGGFRGAYNSIEEANAKIVELVAEDPTMNQGLEAQETGQHLCLLVKEDGKLEEIAISMSRSKMKVSRQLNTLVRMAGGDRFSRVYRIDGVHDKNDKGETFKNFRITMAGFPSESAYKRAEALYNEIASGDREIVINQDQDDQSEATNSVAF